MRVLSVSSSYDLSQPEERLVSHSRMTASSCPYRYYKEYIERQKPKFESIELGMGKYFHSYVEGRFKEVAAGGGAISVADVIDLEDLVRNFRLSFIWQGRLREPYRICRGNHSIDDFASRLLGVGGNFNSFLRDKLLGHRVEAVEGALQIRSEEVHIRGKHDLITRSPTGRLILWDWKTGRMPSAEYWEDYRDQKVQIGFYASWMRYKFDTADVEGTAVFLRDGPQQHITEKYHPDTESDVLANATAWRRRINARAQYPALANQLCDWCGWNPVCPAHTRARVQVQVPAPVAAQTALSPAKPPAPVMPRPQKQPATSRSRCFIATCAYGRPDAPDVCLLRAFRDDYLEHSIGGRLAIAGYEAIGPKVAELLSGHTLTCKLIRTLIHEVCIPTAQLLWRRREQQRRPSFSHVREVPGTRLWPPASSPRPSGSSRRQSDY